MVDCYHNSDNEERRLMKKLEKLSLVKDYLEKDKDLSLEVTVPDKKSKERLLCFLKDDYKEEYILDDKKHFDRQDIFGLLESFSLNRGVITMKTSLDEGRYYLELRDGHRASLYLNNFGADLASKVRNYISRENRLKKGRPENFQEAFISINVLFVVSVLAVILVSMLVLAR